MPGTAAKVDPKNPDPGILDRAVQVLRNGGVVLFPTDTVYGLGVVQGKSKAVERIYDLKGRDPHKLLTVHLARVEDIRPLVKEFSEIIERAIQELLPGPVTLVLKGKHQRTVGVRVPSDEVSRRLIAGTARPLLATSANVSGEAPPTEPATIDPELVKAVDFFLDSGPTFFGGPSTVLDLTQGLPQILRNGALSARDIKHKLGIVRMAEQKGVKKMKTVLFVCTGNSCRSPMAAFYVEKLLREQGASSIRVVSRGVSPVAGMGATQEAMLVMKEEGLDLSGHTAQNLTDDEIRQAHVIFVMEKFHEEVILSRVPEVRDRIRILKIEDPIGESIAVYRDCLKKIKVKMEGYKDLI